MVPQGSQGVDRVVREVWKTLSVPTGTPGWAWEPLGAWYGRLAARLAHLNLHAEHPSASGGGR
jgi:hypothetical protein